MVERMIDMENIALWIIEWVLEDYDMTTPLLKMRFVLDVFTTLISTGILLQAWIVPILCKVFKTEKPKRGEWLAHPFENI